MRALGLGLLLTSRVWAQDQDTVVMEQFHSLPPLKWEASLVSNSCTPRAQAHCTLSIHQQQRDIFLANTRGVAHPLYLSSLAIFTVDRFSRSFWHTQGYVLPMDTEALPRDTLDCDDSDWLPPGPGPKHPFAWAFQGESVNSMFEDSGAVLQYTLKALGLGLDPLGNHRYALTPPKALGPSYSPERPLHPSAALRFMQRAVSMEFVFYASQFEDRPREGAFCAVEFTLDYRGRTDPIRGAMDYFPTAGARPWVADEHDIYQVLYPHIFK